MSKKNTILAVAILAAGAYMYLKTKPKQTKIPTTNLETEDPEEVEEAIEEQNEHGNIISAIFYTYNGNLNNPFALNPKLKSNVIVNYYYANGYNEWTINSELIEQIRNDASIKKSQKNANLEALVKINELSAVAGISGIGAVKKRRVYKELSLAQQAGVDFTKPFEDLDKDEIKALEKVSHDTGYTETYYKSLQKAYNAISGIGEAYDVVDPEGKTVLTWIEDPTDAPIRQDDDPERYRALQEAREIDEERRYAMEDAARMLEEREKRLAEQRKRLHKAGRSSQMQLFGCGYAQDVEAELYEIWREQIEFGVTDYDYNTWRRLVGDEYAQQNVLPYMR